jgi:prepilin-type N-terminal cleavage/methylation domain-containing protein
VSDQAGAERGFTLLEVLVVSVIIVIVSALTIPALQSPISSDPLKQAALSVAGFTQKAKQAGRSSTRGCRLVITPAENSIAIQFPSDDGEAAGLPRSPAGKADLPLLKLPEGVRLQAVNSEQNESRGGEPVSIWVNTRGMIDSFLLQISDGTRTMVLRNQPFLHEIQISLDKPGTSGA